MDLKVRRLGIIDALGVGSKRKRAIKDDSQVFDLDNRMHGIFFPGLGRVCWRKMWVGEGRGSIVLPWS